jgi:hypothetical protein
MAWGITSGSRPRHREEPGEGLGADIGQTDGLGTANGKEKTIQYQYK